jgi:SAC3/GANP family
MIFGSSPNVAAPTPSFGQNASNAPPNAPFVAPFAAVGSNSSYSAATSSHSFNAPPPQVPTPFATPFANAPSSIPFGASQLQQQPFSSQSASPFSQVSNALPSSTSVAFGVSANVMSSSPIPGAGALSQSLPWNTASSNSIQFEPQPPQRQHFPFGGTPFTPSTTPQTPFDMSSSSAAQDGMEDEDGPPLVGEPPSFAESNKVQRDLAALQAKIAEKKKKIEEKRQRELEEKRKEASSLRPNATPFQPFANAAEVAERNAVRFAESTDPSTKSQLPADLLEQSADLAAQSALRNTGGAGGRAHLRQAVSLVGTCLHMCPDEELLRREREGDIQLLERPDPLVHPVAWTLRDTMVKRFRRSAADYKLDVPEWIRPPDVLERVCSYLEEWVMVRRIVHVSHVFSSTPLPFITIT